MERFKARRPARSCVFRCAALEAEGLADHVVAGDREPGGWQIVKVWRPSTIVLGYDQTDLHKALTEASLDLTPALVFAGSHRPDELHSRFLNE